jgi:phosphatidylinositol 4-kinase
VRENSVLLHKLHTWAAANMAIILSLLARRPYSIKSATGVDMSSKPLFCHPLVTSYVLRSLSQFSDDVIVFFLPQIVQALRHDSSSMLSEFLVELGKRSILIAEQLMWLLSSECMGEEVAEDSTDAATEQSVKSSSIPKSNEDLELTIREFF